MTSTQTRPALTSGLANIAAARGVTLHRVEFTVEGDIDLLGIRPGAQRLPADPSQLRHRGRRVTRGTRRPG